MSTKIVPRRPSLARLWKPFGPNTARCRFHGDRLVPGEAVIHYGTALSPYYLNAQASFFPYARSHAIGPSSGVPGAERRKAVLCCRRCREAELKWLADARKNFADLGEAGLPIVPPAES